MDNPEKRATYGAQDEDKQNKNTTQNEPSYKQLEVKTIRTSVVHISGL